MQYFKICLWVRITQFNLWWFTERNKRETSKMVCYEDYFYCAVENTFATEKKKVRVCLPIYEALPKYIIYPPAFYSWCHSFANLQMKINEFWKWEETCWGQMPEFVSEALDSASGDSRLFQALGEWVLPTKCWVWVSVTKWRDAKCGLGGCDSPLSPWLWLWPRPLPLLCLQVGGWSRFQEGDA